MIKFTKMHGLGNDYIYLNAVTDPGLAQHPALANLATVLSDRHTGIGSDGLILIAQPTPQAGIKPGAGVRMQMFNADGSEAEMCGNGIRCVCKFVIDHALVTPAAGEQTLKVETAAGILDLVYTLDHRTKKVAAVTVDLGSPILELSEIGVSPRRISAADELQNALFVSLGNPHAILWVDTETALTQIPLESKGPRIENHPAFSNRINVHYAHVISPNEIRIRTWERGTGITRACGTGAAAVCAAGVLSRQTARQVLIHLPGGTLELHWKEQNNHLYLTGPATEVFTGTWPTA